MKNQKLRNQFLLQRQRQLLRQKLLRNQLKAIYRKLDVSSQSELIEWVRGLEKPGERGAGHPASD